MKKYLFLFLIASSVLPLSGQTKGRKTAKTTDVAPVQSAAQAIAKYDFETAESILQSNISVLKRQKQSTLKEEEQLEQVRKAEIKLKATEQVTFIDSLVLPKNQLFDALKTSSECGSVMTYGQFFSKNTAPDCTVFINQLRNKILYAEPDVQNQLTLKESTLIEGKWTDTKQLEGLVSENGDNLNYPFLLNDGVTLYFGAENAESLGGYDIYMTRFDTDEQKYLEPENIGMPFNSPANDYLMMFDEFNNLGWFVTDRNQPADTVCLYTFIPTETRKVYDADAMSTAELASYARISSIKDTWKDMAAVEDARQRLNELREGKEQKQHEHDFTFVINDRKTYYTLSDFKNNEARSKALIWIECRKDLTEKTMELTQLRNQYSSLSAEKKGQIAAQIRIKENDLEQRQQEINAEEKEIRRLELQTVNN